MLLFSVDRRSVCADGTIIYFRKGPLNDRYVSRNPCLFPWSKSVSYTKPTHARFRRRRVLTVPNVYTNKTHIYSYKLHVLRPNPTDPTWWYRRVPIIMEVGRNKYRTRMGIDLSGITRAQCRSEGLTEMSCRRHPNVSQYENARRKRIGHVPGFPSVGFPYRPLASPSSHASGAGLRSVTPRSRTDSNC